jgi:hypothetical protein
MKKIYILTFLLAMGSASFAQTFANAGLETWHSGTSDGKTVHSPDEWYGYDSLVLATGATFSPLIHFGTPWQGNPQNFQETTIVHGGSSSAKLITLKQDTLGFFPAVLSNAKPSVNTTTLLTILSTGTGDPTTALTLSGGTAVTQRITTVSAWVQYKPGIDSTGAAGNDTGIMIVQAIGTVAGRDSTIGGGAMTIAPTPANTWVQITDTIFYTDSVTLVDTIRVSFASSGGASRILDSSTLYVDDVTMTGVPESVPTIMINNDLIKVYPNPVSSILNMDSPQRNDLSCQLFSISGQVVVSRKLASRNAIDVSALPAGLYFYTVSDNTGAIVQKGKVSLLK